jgi:hypothetical protein
MQRNLCVRCKEPTFPIVEDSLGTIDAPSDGTSLLLPFDHEGWPENTGIAHFECLDPHEQKFARMLDALSEYMINDIPEPSLETFFVPGALV